MAYKLVRPVASLALAGFFRKIYLSNTDRIDWNKPVILASNHPTAFTEPCILACFLEQPLHFLVRGDFFKKPIYAFLMRQVHLIPIFRMKDGGYKNLKQNFQTFDYCYAALNENKNIMILAEGSTVYEKRLRPVQKGTARIVFGALEQYPDMDLQIVPVGVNFNFSNRFRSDVMIEIGEPILAQDFIGQYQDNQARAINALTGEIASRMKDGIIHLDALEDDELAEKIWLLHRSARPLKYLPVIDPDERPFKAEKKLADWLNEQDADKKQELDKDMEDYLEELKESGVEDMDLIKGKGSAIRSLLLFLGALPALFGRLANWLPYKLAQTIVDRKVKYFEFYGSVFIGICIGGYTIYYMLLFIFGIAYLGWIGFAGVVAMGLAGLWYIRYYDLWQEQLSARRRRKLNPEKASALLKKRETLVHKFGIPL
jgi:1-acyl-sn-glycerol-3-phosphate acyltransferase